MLGYCLKNHLLYFTPGLRLSGRNDNLDYVQSKKFKIPIGKIEISIEFQTEAERKRIFGNERGRGDSKACL